MLQAFASHDDPASGLVTETISTKPRSCLICRSRRVRCDKQSPCSNCRRAKVTCVLPSKDRAPKWARRFNHAGDVAQSPSSATLITSAADSTIAKLRARVRELESMVDALRIQRGTSHAPLSPHEGSSTSPSPGVSTQSEDTRQRRATSPATSIGSVQDHFGRLLTHDDGGHGHYVSSGFWSRVNDEIGHIKLEESAPSPGSASDVSDDEEQFPIAASIQTSEMERLPAERNAFLFGQSSEWMSGDLQEFRPMPSQIPYLLEVFSENVNFIFQIVHMPTLIKTSRSMRAGDLPSISPSQEALMFSVYYAAVVSMEAEDILLNLGVLKAELVSKYRLGLECALSKADFLNKPDVPLVQALGIFVCMARRQDSPRFVWMMTGLLVRIAQYLGLQRDGERFNHLSPFAVEMRRRVWWAVCMLDLRASEDQGTDLAVPAGSFDTKIPLNIDEADLNPEATQAPVEKLGLTEMTFPRIHAILYDVMRRIMAPVTGNKVVAMHDKSKLLDEIFQTYQEHYFRHNGKASELQSWVAETIARLTTAKMALIAFLPVLFAAPGEELSDEIRARLLVAAIEVAEYNHALNAERACRSWRWIFQTYTHWHAVAFLMLEISRRPWSPLVERAWLALHSGWLIPPRTSANGRDVRVWFPLGRLMAKARAHRAAELARLRQDAGAAAALEAEDRAMPAPSSPGPGRPGWSLEASYRQWRELVGGAARDEAQDNTTGARVPVSSVGREHQVSRQACAGVAASTHGHLNPQAELGAFMDLWQCAEGDGASCLSMAGAGIDAAAAFDLGTTFDLSSPFGFEMELDGADIDWQSWVGHARGMEAGTWPDGH